VKAKDVNSETFQELYRQNELLVVEGAFALWANTKNQDLMSAQEQFQHISNVCNTFSTQLQKTFTVETNAFSKLEKNIRLFFKQATESPGWYVSAILQDSDEILNRFFDLMPLRDPPLNLYHDKCVWCFVGKSETASIVGRTEHKDIISASGSWHLQTRWKKIWYVREDKNSSPVAIVVNPGDMIFINTRKWFHQTEIPKSDHGEYSISYARDFWLDYDDFKRDSKKVDKSNIETPWANNDIPKGGLVISEKPLFAVQDVRNRIDYLVCCQCFKPLDSVELHLNVFAERVSRQDLVNGNINSAKFIPMSHLGSQNVTDSNLISDLNHIFCSEECRTTSKSNIALMLWPTSSDSALSRLFTAMMKTGHFETLYLAAVALLSNWTVSDSFCDSAELDNWWEVEEDDNDGLTVYCTDGLDCGFSLDDQLTVTAVEEHLASRLAIGEKLVSICGHSVSSKAEALDLKSKIDELRQNESEAIIGLARFPYDWVGVEFKFTQNDTQKQGIGKSNLETFATEAWCYLSQAVEEVPELKRLNISPTKREFFKVARFFYHRASEICNENSPVAFLRSSLEGIHDRKLFEGFVGKRLGLSFEDILTECPHFVGQAFYENISTIPSSGNPNCCIEWKDGSLELCVKATRHIKAGEDLSIPIADDYYENEPSCNAKQDIENERSQKRQRIVPSDSG